MKTTLLFQRIPLEDNAAQDSVQTVDFNPMTLFEQCPNGYRANKTTLQYRFTDTHLIISCEIAPKESSTEFSEARPASQ